MFDYVTTKKRVLPSRLFSKYLYARYVSTILAYVRNAEINVGRSVLGVGTVFTVSSSVILRFDVTTKARLRVLRQVFRVGFTDNSGRRRIDPKERFTDDGDFFRFRSTKYVYID